MGPAAASVFVSSRPLLPPPRRPQKTGALDASDKEEEEEGLVDAAEAVLDDAQMERVKEADELS